MMLAVAVAFVFAAGFVSCEKKAKTLTVRVATQPGVYASGILLAKTANYFAEEIGDKNVSIRWDSFPSGPPMNEAFAAGEEDIGLVGDVPLLIGKASGQPNITFAKVSSGPRTVALTVRPDSPIARVEDLRGKKVAFVKGSYGHHLLHLILQTGGLDFDDIDQVNLANADIGGAVARGDVDAGIIWEPGLTSSLASGTVKKVVDGADVGKSNNIYYFATEKFAKEHPEILVAYIKALVRAADFIKEDPRKAAELVKGEVALDPGTMAELYASYDFSPVITQSDFVELRQVDDFNRSQGFQAAPVDLDAFITIDFLRQAGVQ